jgi:hypothetical protein
MLPCGYAFLDGNDEEQDYHLHIVATDADASGDAIVVSVSTLYRFADRTVLLKPVDHPWLKHDSYVAYSFARLRKIADIEARLARLPQMVRQGCSESLIRRIQDGILESEQSEHGIKNYYREVRSR